MGIRSEVAKATSTEMCCFIAEASEAERRDSQPHQEVRISGGAAKLDLLQIKILGAVWDVLSLACA